MSSETDKRNEQIQTTAKFECKKQVLLLAVAVGVTVASALLLKLSDNYIQLFSAPLISFKRITWHQSA